MDQQQALKILISHSFLLSEDLKVKLLAALSKMTSEETVSLGRFLAAEKKKAIASNAGRLQNLEQLLKEVEQKSAD